MLAALFFLTAALAPCPSSPNCVSSEATDPKHAIAPFPLSGSPETDLDLLASIILSLPRTEIIEHTPSYLHAVFTSKIFRFKDDVVFLVNPDKNVIEVRSASRLGYGDFGVNRERIETLRKIYLEKLHS